jgi:hypothetical protein
MTMYIRQINNGDISHSIWFSVCTPNIGGSFFALPLVSVDLGWWFNIMQALKEEIEDTKEVIRIHVSKKNRQNNG